MNVLNVNYLMLKHQAFESRNPRHLQKVIGLLA